VLLLVKDNERARVNDEKAQYWAVLEYGYQVSML